MFSLVPADMLSVFGVGMGSYFPYCSVALRDLKRG